MAYLSQAILYGYNLVMGDAKIIKRRVTIIPSKIRLMFKIENCELLPT